jgi:hypothetical protein
MEQLDYNRLYCWFVGLSPDDTVWDPTSFTENRERLQNGDVFTKLMNKNHPQIKGRAFSVDGTLIEAWASQRASAIRTAAMTATARTFTARGARTIRMQVRVIPTVAFAKPAGREAKLSHNGEPAWAGVLTLANGIAERRASEGGAENQGQGHRITAGEDKAYDTADHVTNLRALIVTPHVTQNNGHH